MNKYFSILVLVFFVLACQPDKPDLLIHGNIKGLKKGKIFLQKLNDSVLVNVDSIEIYNDNTFEFQQKIEYPEVMYIQLQKDTIDLMDNFISFFADKGELKVEAKLDEFMFAKIESDYENQQKFEEYYATMRKFGSQKLDLIESELEARRINNADKLDSVNIAYNKMKQRRTLYTINYALANTDLEMAPYIVLEQVNYISQPYLDTIYNKLDQKIQNSHYGLKLNELIN